MEELDSIQAGVGAFILGVKRTCSHEAIRKELGWKSMTAIIYTRKLHYWMRLNNLNKENWANKAYRECFDAKGKGVGDAWLSRWRSETMAIIKECGMWDPFKYHKNPKKSIRIGVERWERKRTEVALKGSSLAGMPKYKKKSNKFQEYINNNEVSIAIAKFRLGDTKLGNRDSPAIKDCRLCPEGKGENNETHILFNCKTVDKVLKEEMPILKEFKEKHKNEGKDKLKLLLGGDKCLPRILIERGKQLADLLRKIQDMLEETEFRDRIQEMED